MAANIARKSGRHPNKYYDPTVVLQAQIEAVKEVYDDCEEIKATALELGLAELKVRKLLITGKVISYEQTDTIKSLQREGKTLGQIITITGLSRASINGYLPYTKVPYIESFFKNSKEYLKLLPLCKWSDTTVRGKILSDVITAIVKLNMLQIRKSSELSMSSVIGKCQSLFCIKDSKTNKVFIEKPNKQVRECYENFGITVLGELDLTTYIDELLGSNE